MKQLYKTSIILLLLISLFSCINEDGDIISSQDLLIGKWQTIAYTENGIIPDNFTVCDLEGTMEFLASEIIFTDYILDEASRDCILDEDYSYNYEIIDDNSYKVTRPNGNMFFAEILELNTLKLKVKSIYNNGSTVKIEIFTKIN